MALLRYEWKDGYGDVAPRIAELELVLFGGESQMLRGEHMGNFASSSMSVHGPENHGGLDSATGLLCHSTAHSRGQ